MADELVNALAEEFARPLLSALEPDLATEPLPESALELAWESPEQKQN